MKPSTQPRHFAPHKRKRPMANSREPGHHSGGGKIEFKVFEDVVAYLFGGLARARRQKKLLQSKNGGA